MQTAVQISIHALRVEGDHLPLSFLHTVLYFYPRPPGWRATTVGRIACAFEQFLSTPSGWRATIITLAYGAEKILISIHALRVEGDVLCVYRQRGVCISIHALRVEGDTDALNNNTLIMQFLSTPSGWRATLSTHTALEISLIFLSTPSGWRATGSFNYRNFDP